MDSITATKFSNAENQPPKPAATVDDPLDRSPKTAPCATGSTMAHRRLASAPFLVHCFSMVKRSKIRAFSDAIARGFHPQRIVLFGSYAYGKPTEHSDVDLLVIMNRTRHKGERMSVRIRHAIPRDFPLDLLVRTPSDVAKRLQWGDPFMCELLEKGKVLYEANDA